MTTKTGQREALLTGGPDHGTTERPFKAVKTVITENDNWYVFSHEREDGVLIYVYEDRQR